MKKLLPFLLCFCFMLSLAGKAQLPPENPAFKPGGNALVVKTVNDTTWFIFKGITLMFPTPNDHSELNRTFVEKDTFYLSLGMGYEQNGLEFTLKSSCLKDIKMEESYVSSFADRDGKKEYRLDQKDWDKMNPDGWKPLIITETGNFKTNYNGELMDTVKNTPLNLAGSTTIEGKRIGMRHILYKITGAKEDGQGVEYIMVFLILGC